MHLFKKSKIMIALCSWTVNYYFIGIFELNFY